MSNIKNQLQKKIKKERGIMFKNKGNFYVFFCLRGALIRGKK